MANDEVPLAMILDIDEVLANHNATVAQVMAAGEQMILSAFGQIINNPNGDYDALARKLAERLLTRLQARLHVDGATLAEA
jgi:hypothetical protein